MFGCAQSAKWEKLASLPLELEENSGMLYYAPNKILFINDSGNKPAILATDTLGNLIQNYCLPGLENVDWEEITQDDKGHIYIGDFGNNRNRRTDLTIYKLDAQAVVNGDDDFDVSNINFRYEDQQAYPPSKKSRNYDMEAMIHIGDSIYLFTKNRTKPFNGYTYCYRLPDTPGDYLAEKIDSFSTGNGEKEAYWVAGASYRDNPKTLLLLGYNKVWMFYYFKGNHFFKGKHSVLYFDNFSQKEAISFMKGNKALYSEEKNTKKDGNLYKLFLPELLYRPDLNLIQSKCDSVYISDHIDNDKIILHLNCTNNSNTLWEAFGKNGQRLYSGTAISSDAEFEFYIDTSSWKKGDYELYIIVNNILYKQNLHKK